MRKLRDRAVYCEISSWVGLSLGAQHYYGTLRVPNGCQVGLTKTHTVQSATHENKWRKRVAPNDLLFIPAKAGDVVDGFESKDELISEAIKVFQEQFPNRDILIIGRISVGDPQYIAVHPDDEVKEKANRIYDAFEEIEGYQHRRNWDKAEKLQDEWDKLVAAKL